MNIIQGAFIPVKEVEALFKTINQKLDVLTEKNKESSTTEWASQRTLAKKYDCSISTICRTLELAISSNSVQMIQPNGGVKKYNVAEVDRYMKMTTPSQKEWKYGKRKI